MYTYEYQDGMIYDVIGDIHGHYDELVMLLKKLGHVREKGEFATLDFVPLSNKRVIFIGDYIDRGPKNLRTIDLIQSMVDWGLAHAIMGNHDFNAVHYATPNPDSPGEYLRPHTQKNREQHIAFLNEVENANYQRSYANTIEWIKTLPVFLKIGNYNFVHACWQPSAIHTLIEGGYMDEKGVFTEKGWLESANPQSPAFKAAETLLKGPEEVFANGYSYEDAHGIARNSARVAWWNGNPATFRKAYTTMPLQFDFQDVAYTPESETLAAAVRQELRALPKDEKIFIGHIWEHGTPAPLSDRVATVDYSVAKGEKLAAYRIDGPQTELRAENFIWIDVAADRSSVQKPIPATRLDFIPS